MNRLTTLVFLNILVSSSYCHNILFAYLIRFFPFVTRGSDVQYTVVGRQSGREVRPYMTQSGEELLILQEGIRTAAHVFRQSSPTLPHSNHPQSCDLHFGFCKVNVLTKVHGHYTVP
jgi:hypothetical protein